MLRPCKGSSVGAACGGGDFEDADLGVADGVGVVVDVDALHVGFAFLEVEMFDVVLLATMNVNGFCVENNESTGEIHFADDSGCASDIDDYEIVAAYGPQADGIGGIGLLRPMIIFSGEMKKTGLGEPRAKIREIYITELFARSNGQFERGAFQMIDEDFQIVRLDESVLRSVAEKIVGVSNDELVERRRGSHEHGAGASTAAASTAGTLPGGGDGAGISGHDDGIQRANINAELERAGGNHATDFSVAEAAFNFASFVRKVAAAVAANGFRFSRQQRIRLLQIGEKNFRVQARIGEDDGLQIVFQKFLRDARGFIDVAAANAQRAIHHGRVVKHEGFFRGWCAVRMEDFDFGFEKACSEVAGVGDGCGATNKLRIAAVKSSDAAEAAQNIAQVAAEDAAVSVQLVEDDVAQIFEEASPARVVRQNSCVQHVRIGKNDVALFANRTAGIGGRVAVVSENAEAILQTLVEVVKFRELVLRERFCWEKI